MGKNKKDYVPRHWNGKYSEENTNYIPKHGKEGKKRMQRYVRFSNGTIVDTKEFVLADEILRRYVNPNAHRFFFENEVERSSSDPTLLADCIAVFDKKDSFIVATKYRSLEATCELINKASTNHHTVKLGVFVGGKLEFPLALNQNGEWVEK